MKKIFLLILAVASSFIALADLPTIIAFPSTAWMKKNGYGNNEQLPNGRTKFNPDLNLAFEDTRFALTAVLRETSAPFKEYCKVEDLKTALDGLGDDEMEFAEYGADIDMSEQLVTVVKPDIKLEIQYVEDVAAKMGPRHRYNVEVSALDAYTNDVIATFNDVTELSSEPVNKQVGKLVSNHMQELLGSMNESFAETVKYGREVRVTCLVKGMSFNQDQAEGKVLKYYVRDIFREIANEGRSTQKKDTDKLQDYRIRIAPSVKIEDVGEILQNRFAGAGISVRVDKKGLGKFVIIFGE
jgi:hypothetical protein